MRQATLTLPRTGGETPLHPGIQISLVMGGEGAWTKLANTDVSASLSKATEHGRTQHNRVDRKDVSTAGPLLYSRLKT